MTVYSSVAIEHVYAAGGTIELIQPKDIGCHMQHHHRCTSCNVVQHWYPVVPATLTWLRFSCHASLPDTTICTTKVTITFFCQYSDFWQKLSFYCFTLLYHTRTQFCTHPRIRINHINTSGTIFLCSHRYINDIHQIPRKTHFSQRRGPSPPFLHHSEFFYMLLMVDRFPTCIYVCLQDLKFSIDITDAH